MNCRICGGKISWWWCNDYRYCDPCEHFNYCGIDGSDELIDAVKRDVISSREYHVLRGIILRRDKEEKKKRADRNLKKVLEKMK